MANSIVDELERLARLHQSGAITDEEYERAKHSLIFVDPHRDVNHYEGYEAKEQATFRSKYLVAAALVLAATAAVYLGIGGLRDSPKWVSVGQTAETDTDARSMVTLAKEMATFASQRAAQEQNSAQIEQTQRMSAHLQKWNFNILTGESVRKKHVERNAILQRSADRLGSATALLRGVLPLSKALEDLQSQELDGRLTTAETQTKLSDAITRALRAFKASPIVTRNERRRFEKRFADARQASAA